MPRFAIFRESRLQAIARLFGSLLFVAVGAWMLWSISRENLSAGREMKVAVGGLAGVIFFTPFSLRFAWASLSPGTLTFSEKGLDLDFGWRHRHWRWHEIKHTEVVRNTVSACMVTLVSGKRVRLFGWDVAPQELNRWIEDFRSSGNCVDDAPSVR